MRTGRVEAFSDGVLAIAITIMVLELPRPDGGDWTSLAADVPVLLAYVLSFVYIGIYWNNHHHVFQAVRRVGGGALWANLHLLFWLSLVPFATGWISERWAEEEGNLETAPVVLYGVLLTGAGFAYFLLERSLIRLEGPGSRLARAVGVDRKGLLSLVLYLASIALSLISPWIGLAGYTAVAVLWLVPDRRVERLLAEDPRSGAEVSAEP